MAKKKGFFTGHAKSSAALVSLIIHSVIVVIAFTFVAVTVITKEDQKFEAKPVNRPKMQLKKLQVPVNVKKKKTQKPKLRKRIVVQPKMNKSMPDIKMPEISGVKGGLGNAAGAGLGGAGGLGFSMPEIELFGVKSKGEKVFVILDASSEMMSDKIGGIPAYTLIKEELVNIMGGLSPTTLFNVVVYDKSKTYTYFPNLVPANDANVRKIETWLEPLNAVSKGMGDSDFGGKTLGAGGQIYNETLLAGKLQRLERWAVPAMLAMKQQADAIFILSAFYGNQRHQVGGDNDAWYASSAGKRWNESFKKAQKLLDEDNAKRRAKGEPPRAIDRNSPWAMNSAYFPDIERPAEPEWYFYTDKDFAKAMVEIREKYAADAMPTNSGLRKRKSKIDFSLNVVLFCVEGGDSWYQKVSEQKFKPLTSTLKGEFKTLTGMSAIQSSVKAEDPE